MLSDLWLDIRLAWRGLSRARGFTGAAIVVLGVGIAGATAMLSLAQGVLLRPLPVRDQQRLIIAWKDLKASGYQHFPFGDSAITSLGERTHLLERVAGVTTNGLSQWVAVGDDGGAAYVKGALVTGGFFEVLDVKPVVGRRLMPADDREGSEAAVVISAGLWQRRYGGSRDVVGRRMMLDERAFTIVGVMPPDIDYPRGVELWRTTRSVPVSETFGDAARQEVDLVARLRTGVTVEQAADELSALTRRFEAEASPTTVRGLTPVVRRFDEVMVGDSRPMIIALLIAVFMVLLIATVNVANLLLMRGEGRRADVAVRMALGASKGRLVRQLLMESVVLSLLSTVVGVAATWAGLRSLITLIPDGLPRVESIRVDSPVIAVVVSLTAVTSLIAALGPAFLSATVDPAPDLRNGARAVTAGGTRRVRGTLVVAQVALAVTVAAGAGVLLRTLLRLQSIDVGVAADHLAVVFLEMPKAKYTDQSRHAQLLANVVESLESVPGISAATPVNLEPFSGGWGVPAFAAAGQTAEQAAANPALGLEAVHENYFKTLGIRILRGRSFTAADRSGALNVAIVSSDVAARTWPGENPIGKQLKWGSAASVDPWLTVVGVATPTRYQELTKPKPTMYVPALQFIVAAQRLVLRRTAPLDVIAAAVRKRVQAIDPDIRVMRVAPFASMFDAPLARPRFNAFLISMFAIVAVFLATIGHYAVIAAHVRQREREIAVRVALGATPWDVVRLVMADSLWLVGIGAAIGLGGAMGGTRLLSEMVFGLEGLDPITLTAAALLLMVAATVASLAPLCRATRVDVMTTLRA
jgi:putative ABC transport system permease protein